MICYIIHFPKLELLEPSVLIFNRNCNILSRIGLLTQLAERGANNAKLVSSILTQAYIFFDRQQIFNNDLEKTELYIYTILGRIFSIILVSPAQ